MCSGQQCDSADMEQLRTVVYPSRASYDAPLFSALHAAASAQTRWGPNSGLEDPVALVRADEPALTLATKFNEVHYVT